MLFFISFFAMIIISILAMWLSNAYETFASSTSIAPSANLFTNTALLMAILPYALVGIFIIIAIYHYSKSQDVVVNA